MQTSRTAPRASSTRGSRPTGKRVAAEQVHPGGQVEVRVVALEQLAEQLVGRTPGDRRAETVRDRAQQGRPGIGRRVREPPLRDVGTPAEELVEQVRGAPGHVEDARRAVGRPEAREWRVAVSLDEQLDGEQRQAVERPRVVLSAAPAEGAAQEPLEEQELDVGADAVTVERGSQRAREPGLQPWRMPCSGR